jgi:DNA-binding ferritin-like protein
MAEVKKLPTKETGLTPDTIYHTLIMLYDTAVHYHLTTTSYAKHKMLDKLYNGLQDYKDSISEYLLGIQAPKRFSTPPAVTIVAYSDSAVGKLLQDGFSFSVSLCAYADSNGYEQLCNLSSELQGLFVKSKYLNTLS